MAMIWWQQLVLVMCGGALGAAGRFWLGGALPRILGEGFPWGTLAANLIGGYLVGLVLAWAHHVDLDPLWRLMIVTGFLGALTTFSSFSAEVVEMMLADRWGQALVTVALHLLGSLAMTYVGIKTAALWIAR